MSKPDAAQRAPRMSAFHWCVFIFVATVCVPAPQRFPASPEVYKAGYALVGALVLMTWLLARSFRGDHALVIPRSFSWLALFVVWAALTLLWAPNTYYGFEQLLEYAAALLIFILVSNALAGRAALARLLNLLLLSAVLLALLACAQDWLGVDWVKQGRSGPAATFGHRNFFMQYLVLTLPLGLALLTRARTRVSMILYVAALTLMYMVFFITFTRAAFVGATAQLVLFGPLYALGHRGDRATRLRGLAAVAGVVASTALVLGAGELLGFETGVVRMGTRLSAMTEALPPSTPVALSPDGAAQIDPVFRQARGTARGRLRFWTNTYHMILEHGLWGVGLGNWRVYYPKFAPEETDHENLFRIYNAHNSWIETAAAVGVPGMLLVLAIAAAGTLALRRLLSTNSGANAFYIGVWLALLGAGINAVFSSELEKTAPLILVSTYLAVLGLYGDRQSGSSWQCDLGHYGRLKWPLLAVMVILSERALSFSVARVNEEILFIQASYQASQEDWAQVEKLATAAIARNPISSRAYAFKGFAAMSLGRPHEAAEALAIFVRTEPYNFNALMNYARALYEAGEVEAALAVILRCLEIRPGARETMRVAAALYREMGDTDSARLYELRAEGL